MSRCPRCHGNGVVVVTDDEIHDEDTHCLLCGWRPVRELQAVENESLRVRPGGQARWHGVSL